ncbi:hypothetical protein AGMMS49960_19440 [Betaproteobacteria bacterium]|nr:hypothetical protein AGMMS49543_14820 [Betaproteobacteria bacterium]GHU04131.1 hypothetical protein AGMMS49960_19440 [Betaproteobacteria bacterium]GHU11255.1 hypothetical protein AGMMS50225_16380 [Betaproteobacteria bacterium]GHU19450.1 hypothetical protein AGMMS50243_11480 [Betaproteobacteria bacterium]
MAAPPELAANAPDSYTVVKGDTLWAISGRFLQHPWRWPEVWRMNEAQIRNPHLIYPGQVILLDRNGPWLSIGHPVGGGGGGDGSRGDGQIEPRIYHEAIDEAINTIPLKIIQPFLTRPLVFDSPTVPGAGTIVAAETSRLQLGLGDTVFAKNVRDDVDDYQIFRPAKPLLDPATGRTIAYEAQHLGTARVTERTNPTTLVITESVEEIGPGDLLLPTERPQIFAYVPHAPVDLIEGRLIKIYRGVTEAGKLNVVVLSAGTEQGLEVGHVLALFRNRGTAVFGEGPEKETYTLPEKRYGTVLVFRVFDKVSYALIMDTDGQAAIGDAARNP